MNVYNYNIIQRCDGRPRADDHIDDLDAALSWDRLTIVVRRQSQSVVVGSRNVSGQWMTSADSPASRQTAAAAGPTTPSSQTAAVGISWR